jgi:hypothetical protein
MDLDPYANDPGRWGASLATNVELLTACLDAVAPRSLLEVGAYAGDVTRVLLDWAARSGARVTAIDPYPEPELARLGEERPALELIRRTSQDALGEVPTPDMAIIDGDHNYFVVSEELRLIAEQAEGGRLPLLLLHDVCWPHARRDSYFTPDLIPAEYRKPMVEGAGLFPGEPGLRPGGLPFKWAAKEEGGPRNGVLTAIEDFVDARQGVRLAVVPAFFGVAVVWPEDAPWADKVAEIVEPLDRNPLLARMEANRVYHLASVHVQMVEAMKVQQRNARQEHLLRELLKSKSFSVAERISWLRKRGKAAVSKADVRRVLAD